MKVCIDPGHGGSDPGAVGGGVNEKDVVLRVALHLRDLLEADGVDAFLTRGDDTFLRPGQRVDLANAKGAALFLSIHCNASINESAHGFEALHYRTSVVGKRRAEIACEEWADRFEDRRIRGAKPDSVSPRGGVTVLRKTRMPAVLVELGFITNAEERDWMLKNEKEMAVALHCAVLRMIVSGGAA